MIKSAQHIGSLLMPYLPLVVLLGVTTYLLAMLLLPFARLIESDFSRPSGDLVALGIEPLGVQTGAVASGTEFMVRGMLHGEVLMPPGALSQGGVDSIKIMVGTYGIAHLYLKSGALNVSGSDCEFVSTGQTIADNSYIILNRQRDCTVATSESRPFEIKLQFAESVPALAVWSNAFAPQPGFALEAHGTKVVAQIKTVYLKKETHSRLELLLFMWRGAADNVRIVLWSAFVLLLLAAIGAAAPGWGHPSLLPSIQVASITMCFVGLCLLYAAITPPFQGPDEPDHFLSLAPLSGDKNFAEHAMDLAQVGHFRAIKQKAGVFSSERMGAKLSGGWVDRGEEKVLDSHMERRSPVTYAAWRSIQGWLHGRSVENQFLTLRLLNIVVVGIAFLLLVIVCGLGGVGGGVQPLFLLIAPALPFFCMHVSNYPFFIAGHFLIGAGLVAFGVQRKDWLSSQTFFVFLGAIFVGVGVALATIASRVGLVVSIPTVLILAVLLGKLMTNCVTRQRRAFFLVGTLVLLGLSMTPLLLNNVGLWLRSATIYILKYSEFIPSFFRDLVGENVRASIITLVVLTTGIGSVFSFYILSLLRGRVVPAWAVWVIRCTVIGIFLVSCVRQNWYLPNIEVPIDFDVWRYIYLAVRTFIKDMGFAAPDFYITSSFWVGFGWLDVPMSSWFIGGVSALPLLVLLMTLFLNVRIELGALVKVGIISIALLLYVAVLANFSFQNRVNLHGRYLVGFYVLYLLQIGGVVSWGGYERSEVLRAIVLIGGLSLVFLLQGFSAEHILLRYFG